MAVQKLSLYEDQLDCIEQLREGFRLKHQCQLLYAPTGAGKTEIAMAMLQFAAEKERRAAMALDRIVLCDQTSARLDKYGIPHGVLQSGHWRYRPHEKIQVCSAQTLEKRGLPGMNLLIIDECHDKRKQLTDFLAAHPEVLGIGLSASPFTKGLGLTYTRVVSATTTMKLVASGRLVPLRVFIAMKIDMKGVKKVAGEYSADSATERGMKITGDVVSEWIKKSIEVFGKPRKTIVFCSNVAHGVDLSQKFAESGFNFVPISYLTDENFKKEAIADFAKPDTKIDGLIACDILTKGFDVPDVMIGISARPFAKSFSSHVQQMGRVMRSSPGKEYALWLDHCIASGQRVLTQRGLVPIEKVLLSDTLWDGREFVRHKGVVSRGIRPIITYAGLTGTPDHPVKTEKGWRTLGQCAEEQTPVITTGVGRTALRERDHHFTGSLVVGRARAALHACALRVRHMRVSLHDFALQLARWAHDGMSPLQSAESRGAGVAGTAGAGHASALPQSEYGGLRELRWARDRIQIRVSDYLRSLDREEFRSATGRERPGIGQAGERRPLRAGQSSLGDEARQHEQSTHDEVDAENARVQARASEREVRGRHAEAIDDLRSVGRTDRGPMAASIPQAEGQVWDVLDCGPRNSFTCEGILVHNSGNYLKFQSEWDDLYENGVQALADDKEKSKGELTDKEVEERRCPKCSSLG